MSYLYSPSPSPGPSSSPSPSPSPAPSPSPRSVTQGNRGNTCIGSTFDVALFVYHLWIVWTTWHVGLDSYGSAAYISCVKI